MVRKERQLGNRQLQDVLQGETALINANSSATAAETDIAIGVYELAAMGRLAQKPFEIDILRIIQTVKVEIATTKLPVISQQ